VRRCFEVDVADDVKVRLVLSGRGIVEGVDVEGDENGLVWFFGGVAIRFGVDQSARTHSLCRRVCARKKSCSCWRVR